RARGRDDGGPRQAGGSLQMGMQGAGPCGPASRDGLHGLRSDLTRSVLALGGVRVAGHGATAVPVRGLQGCSSVRFGLTLPAVEVVEGPQDVAHQPVAYYVFVAEINEMDLRNLGQDLLDLDQA